MDETGIVIILLCFLTAAVIVFRTRKKAGKTMDAIEGMLDAAMDALFPKPLLMKVSCLHWKQNLRTIFPRQRFLLEMRPGKKTE